MPGHRRRCKAAGWQITGTDSGRSRREDQGGTRTERDAHCRQHASIGEEEIRKSVKKSGFGADAFG